MNEGRYYVMLGRSDTLCLAGDAGTNCKVFKFPFIAGYQPVWSVTKGPEWMPPGSFLMQYVPIRSNACARFGFEGRIPLVTFDGNQEFEIHFDDVGDGLVAINNHDHSRVIDANGNNPGIGANVSPWPWNGGDNQRWRFVPAP